MRKTLLSILGVILVSTAQAQDISDSSYVKIGSGNIDGIRTELYLNRGRHLLKLYEKDRLSTLIEIDSGSVRLEDMARRVVYGHAGEYSVTGLFPKHVPLQAPGNGMMRGFDPDDYEWKSYVPEGKELAEIKELLQKVKEFYKKAKDVIR